MVTPTNGAAVPASVTTPLMLPPGDNAKLAVVVPPLVTRIGVVVVIVKKALVEKGRKDIPKIFQFRTAAENKSLYNTPPTFGIYMVRNVLAWLKERGGLAAVEAANRKKAARLYGAIDANAGFYGCPVEKESRSVMNVVFRLPSEADEERFVKEAKAKGMVGLKGHRSVGGIRASISSFEQAAFRKPRVRFSLCADSAPFRPDHAAPYQQEVA